MQRTKVQRGGTGVDEEGKQINQGGGRGGGCRGVRYREEETGEGEERQEIKQGRERGQDHTEKEKQKEGQEKSTRINGTG